MRRLSRTPVATALIVAAALATAIALAPPATAEVRTQDEVVRALKQLQVELNAQGAQRKRAALHDYMLQALKAQRDGTPLPYHPLRAREAVRYDDLPQSSGDLVTDLGTSALLAIPTNVRANNPATDVLVGSGQAESSIGSIGSKVIVSWNDGDGFSGGSGAPHVQGYAYSSNGGASYTDGGTLPIPAAFPAWAWFGDPVVTQNEKTGEFWIAGLIAPTATTNGLGIVKATMPGAVPVFGTPVAAASKSNATNFLDKEWIAADSSNGNVYMSYTNFFVGGNQIEVIRSTDGGATWSAPIIMNSAAANGFVQGSRPVVGPNGEVYVVWKEIGTTGLDFMKVRKSVNGGVSYGPEATAVSYYDNFGTGAPGFNRERAVSFPSIAVDRTTGPNRGRIYIAYHESYNFYDDPMGGLGNLNETEANGSSATANLFTPGQTLRAAFANSADQDWFRFNATAGTDYLFWCDSIPNQYYQMRVFCSNGSQLLAYAGDVSGSPGGTAFYTWTAPTTATYYLRMNKISGGAASGGYRILTGVNGGGPERGRDHRDVFVARSDDGVAWSAPVLVNDDAALYDDWLPEVGVGADGCPYVMWYDWRDAVAVCGGNSHIYVSRSGNGGTTWDANQRATDVTSNWTTSFTNIAPNQGDYSHIWGDASHIRWTWADARSGNADCFVAGLDMRHSIVACQGDVMGTPGMPTAVSYTVNNPNDLFANDLMYSFSDQRGWPMPSASTINVGAAANGVINASVNVPDTALAGMNRICLTVTNKKGTMSVQCCFDLTIDQATPVLLTLADSQADPDRVSLAWFSGGDAIGQATVYRRTASSEWAARGTLPPDGNGRIAFEDRSVTPGERYGYRLGVVDRGSERFYGETWVDVPRSLALAITSLRPNPAGREAWVNFSLPADGPVTVSVIDVSGRTVRTIDRGTLSAGRHQLNLTDRGRLPAGVYLVRVQQAEKSATARLTIVQ